MGVSIVVRVPFLDSVEGKPNGIPDFEGSPQGKSPRSVCPLPHRTASCPFCRRLVLAPH